LSRISQAFRSFFGILFGGELPAEVATAYGYAKEPAQAEIAAPEASAPDGAVQMLSILQRDSRLIDFLMEDIAGATDDQIGAAVRAVHEQARQSLTRYIALSPVIDGVEGTYTRLEVSATTDASAVKLLGKVPADGKAAGGTLRHRGWRASRVELPPTARDTRIVAPAEIEIE
jgi:hypothetical protein